MCNGRTIRTSARQRLSTRAKGNYYADGRATYVIIPARVEKLNVTESAETTAKLTWSAAPGATYCKVYSCNKSGETAKCSTRPTDANLR